MDNFYHADSLEELIRKVDLHDIPENIKRTIFSNPRDICRGLLKTRFILNHEREYIKQNIEKIYNIMRNYEQNLPYIEFTDDDDDNLRKAYDVCPKPDYNEWLEDLGDEKYHFMYLPNEYEHQLFEEYNLSNIDREFLMSKQPHERGVIFEDLERGRDFRDALLVTKYEPEQREIFYQMVDDGLESKLALNLMQVSDEERARFYQILEENDGDQHVSYIKFIDNMN